MELFWNLDKPVGQFLEPLLCYVHQQQRHKAAVCHWGDSSPTGSSPDRAEHHCLSLVNLSKASTSGTALWAFISQGTFPLTKHRPSTLPFITLGCPCLAPVIAEIPPPACSPPLVTASMKHPILMWDSGTASSVFLSILSYATWLPARSHSSASMHFLGGTSPHVKTEEEGKSGKEGVYLGLKQFLVLPQALWSRLRWTEQAISLLCIGHKGTFLPSSSTREQMDTNGTERDCRLNFTSIIPTAKCELSLSQRALSPIENPIV